MSDRPSVPCGEHELGELLWRAASDEAPPAAVRARVVGLFGDAPLQAASGASGSRSAAGALGRRLIAEWIGGGGAGGFAPAFGMRGTALGSSQRLYRAEQCEIDVRIVTQGESWQLAGQLFGIDAVKHVTLSGPGFEASAAPDVTQEFGFSALPAGTYTLTVKAGELDIVIPAIEVGSASGA